ncbi:MAG: bifunctional oligoribonuclease/PAP phosphatase NrnA [Deferribacteres bacterium]|nr:bifunctional oligoribonuclease/PAP phosphatase NrnA [candidate division KSB1 bacterium]MCB9512686.1 bifunctional oligoribonuclease/PAP phosphatase NrnA [Deferribacteres bacterium]
MLKKADIDTIDEIIRTYQQFIVTTHVNPDGDAIGSEIAFAHFLKQRKKSVKILNSSPAPDVFQFLDPNGEIEIYDASRHIEYVSNADAVFILDISDWGRLRELGEFIRGSHLTKVCIDHHPKNEPFVEHDAIYPKASSTGELIFELLHGLDAKLTTRISEALYTAILTDTGVFRYSNTTPRVHQIAAELLGRGINPQQIHKDIYENQSHARVKLMASALASLKFHYENQLATMIITQKMLAEAGASLKDTDGLSDFPRTIEGVEIALLFIELDNDRVKISFRSNGNLVINKLAQSYNGGGHAFASGATLTGTLDGVMQKVLTDAAALFRSR